MIIIALTGPAGSGKDTAAIAMNNYLIEFAIANCHQINFADKLKYTCMDLFNLSESDCFTPNGKTRFIDELNMTVREVLQKFGTEVARNIHPNIWVNYVVREIQNLDSEGLEFLFISDLRFQNEYEALKCLDQKVYFIKTDRPGHEIEHSNHISENSLDPYNQYDYNISANTPAQVESQAISILNLILKNEGLHV